MPHLQNLDRFSDKTIRYQIVAMDYELSGVGVLTCAPGKGIPSETLNALKNLLHE